MNEDAMSLQVYAGCITVLIFSVVLFILSLLIYSLWRMGV